MELLKIDSEDVNCVYMNQSLERCINKLVTTQLSLTGIKLRLYAGDISPIIENKALHYRLST
jgi:hypothetical protein